MEGKQLAGLLIYSFKVYFLAGLLSYSFKRDIIHATDVSFSAESVLIDVSVIAANEVAQNIRSTG